MLAGNTGIGWDAVNKKVTSKPSAGFSVAAPSSGIMDTITAQQRNGVFGKFGIGGLNTSNKSAGAQAVDALTAGLARGPVAAIGQQVAVAAPQAAPAQQGFTYNAEADPAYQAALRQAQANAATAGGNAQAEMNRRGILDSTITGDRIAQIQQSELGRVSDTILPQLMQQAYGRYRDDIADKHYNEETAYNHGRDALADTRYTDETTYNRGRDSVADKRYNDETYYNHNRDTVEDKVRYRQEQRANMESDRAFNYGKGRDKIADDRYVSETEYAHGRDKRGDFVDDRNFNRGVLESDRGFNRGVFESNRSYNSGQSNRNSDNARADQNASYGRLMDIWKATGKAPQGMSKYGVTPGTLYGGEQSAKPPADNDVYAEVYTNLDSMTPDQRGAFLKGEKSGLIKQFGPTGYKQLYSSYFDEDGNPI